MIVHLLKECNGVEVKILVTGGFGFIGRNLTERLVKDGHEVTVVASGSEPHVHGVKKEQEC